MVVKRQATPLSGGRKLDCSLARVLASTSLVKLTVTCRNAESGQEEKQAGPTIEPVSITLLLLAAAAAIIVARS